MKRHIKSLGIGSTVVIGSYYTGIRNEPIEWIKVDDNVLISKLCLFNSKFYSKWECDAREVGDDEFFNRSDLKKSMDKALDFSIDEAKEILDLRVPMSRELKKHRDEIDHRFKYFKKHSCVATTKNGDVVPYWCMNTDGMADFVHIIAFNGYDRLRSAVCSYGSGYSVRPLIILNPEAEIELRGERYVLAGSNVEIPVPHKEAEEENENPVLLENFLGLW